MLVAGYAGEAGLINAWAGFIVGMAGWLYILYEIFAGEAGKASAEKAPSISAECLWNDAVNRYSWLGNLSTGLFLWISTNAADRCDT